MAAGFGKSIAVLSTLCTATRLLAIKVPIGLKTDQANNVSTVFLMMLARSKGGPDVRTLAGRWELFSPAFAISESSKGTWLDWSGTSVGCIVDTGGKERLGY